MTRDEALVKAALDAAKRAVDHAKSLLGADMALNALDMPAIIASVGTDAEVERLRKLTDDAGAVIELQRSERLRLQERVTELEALLREVVACPHIMNLERDYSPATENFRHRLDAALGRKD